MKQEHASSKRRQRKIQILALASSITILLVLSVIARVPGTLEYRKIAAKEPQEATTGPPNGLGRQVDGAEEKVKISVEDPRPLAKAITMLEARFGWVITYEDPRYVNASEMTDVTEKVRRDLNKFRPGEAPRVLIPKGGAFVFDYDTSGDSTGPPDPVPVVQRLLAAYAASGHAGRFRMEKGDKIIHVVPTAIKDISGKLAPQESVLDVVITLPAKEKTGLQTLEALCAAVSKSVHLRVVVGMIPTGLFLQHKDHQEIKTMKARDALVRLLDRTANGTKLSWQLLYDPGLKMYALNIHPVP